MCQSKRLARRLAKKNLQDTILTTPIWRTVRQLDRGDNMRRIMLVGKEDKKILKRLASKKGTRTSDELHRILSYYLYVSNTRDRLNLGKPTRKKVVKDTFKY